MHDPAFYRRLALEGSLGAAESFLDGDWTCDDLVGLIRIAARSGPATARFDRGPARLVAPLRRLGHFVRRNTLRGSRKNIEAHYDLGDDFFASFLDRSMTYSCGLFPRPETTLAEAQQAKYARLCAKLGLTADDRVVEIGTGWGGFALHAARRHGCRLTTTTISRRQYAHAARRLTEEGLTGQVELVDLDYRRLEGAYDKLVSIEMIEAVGHHYLPTFFGVCSRLLHPDGCMALQAITIPDQRYDGYRRRVDFIQRHIFPGGCLPSLGAISDALATSGDLRIVHVEDLADHYARTLALWRTRLTVAREALLAAGYSERLLRTWDYYFAYCEGGFRERQIGLAQIVLAKPAYRAPVVAPSLDPSADDQP